MLFDMTDYQEFDIDYRAKVDGELKTLLPKLFPAKIIKDAAYIKIKNDSNDFYQSLRSKYSVSIYNDYYNHIDGVILKDVPMDIYSYVKQNHEEWLERTSLG